MKTSKETTARECQWLLDEKYAGVETPAFFVDLVHLAQGEPLAYLIGQIPFLDATIFLDSRPLIPRPETEYWVAHAIAEIRARGVEEQKLPLSVLDLCAGSGCIGVSVLKILVTTMPDAHVDFCEIDVGHHDTITKNLRENNIDPERARIHSGDLLTEVAKAKPKYNFILTNPPYIDPKHIDHVEKSVTGYEPARALFGGTDGMEYIARIIREAPQYLTRPGVLYIEHEPKQKELIHTLAQSLSYTSCDTYKDQWQMDRYTRLTF